MSGQREAGKASERVWLDGNGEETPISRFMGEQIERVLSEHPLAKPAPIEHDDDEETT